MHGERLPAPSCSTTMLPGMPAWQRAAQLSSQHVTKPKEVGTSSYTADAGAAFGAQQRHDALRVSMHQQTLSSQHQLVHCGPRTAPGAQQRHDAPLGAQQRGARQ